MEDMTPCSAESREVFRRVWSRVMGERAENCPIELLPGDMEGDLSCMCLEDLDRRNRAGSCQADQAEAEGREEETPSQPGQEAQMEQLRQELMRQEQRETEAQEAGPAEGDGQGQGSDMPAAWTEPAPADDRTGRLRRQVLESLEGWQFYRHLARRTRGCDARTLNALAGELHRQARKLAAAYFLLTGVRYWPSETLATPVITSYWGALRNRHQAEQQQEMAFRISGDDWTDPDLLELYQQLTEACQQRARQLRALLEQGS